MLRCGHCDVICDSYEEWLVHLVSDRHQALLGVSDALTSFADEERNERSLIMAHMNPSTNPYDVICYFASDQPLGFITDAYVHIFPNVHEKFFLIVFDQKKFVDRIVSAYEQRGRQKMFNSVVTYAKKASLTEKDWADKLEGSFFYRRHEFLRRQFPEMNWDQQLTKLLSLISLDGQGYVQRENVMEELESLLHVECEDFKDATVEAFGSCTTWLADVNADLDVYVDATGEGGRSDMDDEKKQGIMTKVIEILRERYGEKNLTPIWNTRVPIIIFYHPSGLKLDISFENCTSVQNSKMIRLMTKLDYRVRSFLLFLRYWARYHNLIGSQSIKSYALVLMAFVFLRKKKILPSVHELQNIEGTRSFMVCNWNCGFCNNRDKVQRELPWLKCCRDPPSADGMGQEIMRLCYEFFNEYLAVDFQSIVVAPLIGDYLPKEKFESQFGKDLPTEMELLKANLATGICTSFNTYRPLCIQDPFTLNINVTSSCANPEIVYQFKTACYHGAEALRPFIKTYGLADREVILDLCCQPISETKMKELQMEDLIRKMRTSDAEAETENHDHLAYVKTEATTTTTDDGQASSDQKVTSSSSTEELEDALESVKKFYKDNFGFTTDLDLKRMPSKSSRSGGNSSRRRTDEETGRVSSQIIRVSAFEKDDSFSRLSSPKRKSLVEYEYDGGADDEKEKSLPGSKSLVKSIVVVPNQSQNLGRSRSPSSSSTSSSSRTRAARSVSPGYSPRKKKNRHEEKMDLSDKAERSPKNEIVESQNNKKSIIQPKIEPVVTFVPTPPKHSTEQNVTKKVAQEEVDKVDIAELEEFYKSLKEGTPPRLTVKVEIGPSTSDNLTPPEVMDFNYGYKTSKETPSSKALSATSIQHPSPKIKVETNPSPVTATLKETESDLNPLAEDSEAPTDAGDTIPPLLDDQIRPHRIYPNVFPDLPQTMFVCASRFPDLILCMDKTFQKHFLSFYSPITTRPGLTEEIRHQKMKYQWSIFAEDFLNYVHFWKRLEIIVESLEMYKIDCEPDFSSIYQKLKLEGQPLLSQFEFVRSEEVAHLEYPPKLSTTAIKPTWCDGPPLSYPSLCFLNSKFVKISSSPPKRMNACAYCFVCYHEVMMNLYERWQKLSSIVFERCTMNKGPLEVFGQLCSEVQLTAFPTSEPVMIKLLVAFDATACKVPGVFIGFQTYEQDFDPTFEKQAIVQHILKEILEDLLQKYALHRVHKYVQK